jgi:hypothetical protein
LTVVKAIILLFSLKYLVDAAESQSARALASQSADSPPFRDNELYVFTHHSAEWRRAAARHAVF